jgi:energy-coupling factor transport system permease protein
MAGVRLGGDVMLESVLIALFDGLRLATILICIGAANSLASPSRLLKSLPAALYEIGVSVVVALTFTPQLITDVTRVQSARRLRGRPTRGVKAIAGAAMPVLEGALEHSVALAAAMDSRGYGRRAGIPVATRRTSGGLLVAGLIAACVGVYALVAADTSAVVGVLLLIAGSTACILALALSARGNVRTRYRPDPWWLPEWLVSGSGILAALAFAATAWAWPGSLTVLTDPPTWPGLPIIPLLAIALAATPMLTAPPLPAPRAVIAPRARQAVPA